MGENTTPLSGKRDASTRALVGVALHETSVATRALVDVAMHETSVAVAVPLCVFFLFGVVLCMEGVPQGNETCLSGSDRRAARANSELV